jgi:hypothetical protein
MAGAEGGRGQAGDDSLSHHDISGDPGASGRRIGGTELHFVFVGKWPMLQNSLATIDAWGFTFKTYPASRHLLWPARFLLAPWRGR